MDKDLLVTKTLSETMINAGKELLEQLDNIGLTAPAAFWLFIPELETWRLMIATPEVRVKGPKQVYNIVQKAIAQMPAPKIRLEDTSIVDESNMIVQLLEAAFNLSNVTGVMRFVDLTINGVLIHDVLVYRLPQLYREQMERRREAA